MRLSHPSRCRSSVSRQPCSWVLARQNDAAGIRRRRRVRETAAARRRMGRGRNGREGRREDHLVLDRRRGRDGAWAAGHRRETGNSRVRHGECEGARIQDSLGVTEAHVLIERRDGLHACSHRNDRARGQGCADDSAPAGLFDLADGRRWPVALCRGHRHRSANYPRAP